MKPVPKISETEWEVMRVVWAKQPCNASDVIEALSAADRSWHPKTVKTLLNRLVRKGALRFKRDGRSYLYRPAVAEEVCVAAASDSFLERVFGGALTPMLAHFVGRGKLSPEEIQELKALLKEGSKS
ncbi:MAG: BlaI/MecI/CopY family transcriptional regulator [Verrucomicrobiota bacterium]